MTTALPSALENFDALVPQFLAREPALFCDYDGTLTPIVERPELAILADSTRQTLRRLSEFMPVAMVSGRALIDLRDRVGLDSLWYVGNHGLESSAPDGRKLPQHGAECRPDLSAALGRLEPDMERFPGAIVEDKGLSASVHYRLLSPALVPRLESLVDRALADHPNVEKRHGKKVFELRPAGDWNKGRIVSWLCEQMQLSDPWPLSLGDDSTDEDAFAVVREHGLGIRVGPPDRDSRARLSLRDPGEAAEFLSRLAAALEHADA